MLSIYIYTHTHSNSWRPVVSVPDINVLKLPPDPIAIYIAGRYMHLAISQFSSRAHRVTTYMPVSGYGVGMYILGYALHSRVFSIYIYIQQRSTSTVVPLQRLELSSGFQVYIYIYIGVVALHDGYPACTYVILFRLACREYLTHLL